MEVQHARINLRRLLRRCEGPRSAVHGPEQRTRLASFVGVLERLWHQLEESSECSEDELAECARAQPVRPRTKCTKRAHRAPARARGMRSCAFSSGCRFAARPPPQRVHGRYWRRIEGVAELLDDQKLLSGSTGALANSRAHANARITRAQANAELAGRATVACARLPPPYAPFSPSATPRHPAACAQRGCTRSFAVS